MQYHKITQKKHNIKFYKICISRLHPVLKLIDYVIKLLLLIPSRFSKMDENEYSKAQILLTDVSKTHHRANMM